MADDVPILWSWRCKECPREGASIVRDDVQEAVWDHEFDTDHVCEISHAELAGEEEP